MKGDLTGGRCGCGKTAGHVLSPGSACWPVPLASTARRSTIRYPNPNSLAAVRIRAQWAEPPVL